MFDIIITLYNRVVQKFIRIRKDNFKKILIWHSYPYRFLNSYVIQYVFVLVEFYM